MTLVFISRAGDGGAGDPPDAWLMPLIGDAVVGITALGIAWLLWRRPNPTTWLLAVMWNAIAAFDALAAYVVDVATPWPEFFYDRDLWASDVLRRDGDALTHAVVADPP